MNSKTNLALIFGGKSAEHEVSVQSAKNILEAIDKKKYNVILIGIDKEGKWYYFENHDFLVNKIDMDYIELSKKGNEISFFAGNNKTQFFVNKTHSFLPKIDVIFSIVHGTQGEDGSIQGMFKIMNIPFVGADILGSSIGMDKEIMKKILRDADLPIGKFLTFNKYEIDKITDEIILKELKYPVFIKPANMGSSVGVGKASNFLELKETVKTAFKYDNKILIEEFIKGREVECGVLGNYSPKASTVGNIITNSDAYDFYSYEAKYLDEKGAILEIPIKAEESIINQIRKKAIETFKVLNCYGLARVDFFLTDENEIFINEINTLPGFTKISMYPKLWEYSGIKYSELIDQLIQLAIQRFEELKTLKFDH